MSAKDNVERLLAIINKATYDAIGEYEKTSEGVPSLNSADSHALDALTANVPLKRAIRLLEGACDQLCATLAPPAHTIVNRGQDYQWSCLRVVNEARVTDVLANHPGGLHVDVLSKLVKIESGKLSRIMRILATRSCYREVDTNVFANNRLSVALHSSNPLSDFVKMLTYEGAKAAFVLHENLTDAECGYSYEPNKSPYMYSIKDEGIEGSFFDWQKLHPERRQTFGRGMIAMNDVMGSTAVLDYFPWKNVSTVCDVGSGLGSFSLPLTKKFPHITVTLHDLPGTIDEARKFWVNEYPEAVEAGGARFVPWNFFEDVPIQGQDIYYLRNIIHNWPDVQALSILSNVSKAMSANSRLLIHDYVLQHLNRSAGTEKAGPDLAPEPMLPNFGHGTIRAYNQDLVMLFMYNSRERTLVESVAMAERVGLRLNKVWDLAETSVLEFVLAENQDDL